MPRHGISTGRLPRNVGKLCFQWFRNDNIMRPDGSVIKIKALLGVRSKCLLSLLIWQEMQENQLYVFDPKAMHQIVVKVRFISPNYLLLAPISINIPGSIHLRRDHVVHWVPGIFTIRWPPCIKTRFPEETSSFLALDFLELLVSTFSPRITGPSRRFVGEQHRKQRKMLNPVFSIAHLRDMSKLWPFFWSPRTERTTVPTFYRVSFKVPLHLNLPSWRWPPASFETPSLERWRMVHRRLAIVVLPWLSSQYLR